LKVFVTGIEGFVGRHLANHLLTLGHEVSGTVWNENQVSSLQVRFSSLRLLPADVRDPDVMKKILRDIKPDAVFHLAAQSSGAYSFKKPRLTFEVNVLGTVNLLDTIAQTVPDTRIVLICSSDVYGNVPPDRIPITEDTPLRPVNPYSASKAAQDILGLQYVQSHGLDVIRTRSFPHTGPGQNAIFALSNFARQISSIESIDFPKPIGVGNLEVIRDYLDVEDVVRAYAHLIETGRRGDVYNISSGVGYSLGELLDMMISLSSKEIKVEEDPALFRPVDIPVLIGDSTRFRKLTGWKPTIDLQDTLHRLLEDWRIRQRQGAL
jgi:GDP-4-dehydro-6-deoxy-D-mannose reductase